MTLDANIINFSPLPFYKSAAGQNARRWWVYNVYPLFASNKSLIPFQIIREHKTSGAVTPTQTHQESGLAYDGSIQFSAGTNVYEYSVEQFPFGKITIQCGGNGGYYPSDSEILIACLDENNTLIQSELDLVNSEWQSDDAISGTYELPAGTKKILVCSELETQVLITNSALAEIYSEDGQYVGEFYLTIESGTEYDVLIGMPSGLNLAIGRYYLVVKDGFDGEWVSDILTVVEDDFLVDGNYVKMEWYDQSSLVSDSGIVSYQNGYKNIIYIRSDIAKPEYMYEEDGENRDGYFFPEKQISKKRYKFGFLAPEYLLDVLRLVRLSDYVKITYKGREYQCSEILITPTWESEGDLASVAVEFDTNTVVKAVGRILV